MKKLTKILTSILLVATIIAGCGSKASTNDVEMKKISVEEAHAKLGASDWTFVDTRKASDYEVSHIENAVSLDMDVVVTGNDEATAKANAAKLIPSLNGNNLIIVCYSGNRYAKAATKALSENGYDMSKVFTLDGGMKEWNAKTPTKAPAVAKNRVYVDARWVKSVIDGNQSESSNYVVAYVNYGAEPDDAYKKAHIPGAIVVGDVDVEDATGSEEGAYNLLKAEEMEKIALSRGIDKDTTVILYGDDVNGVARVAYGYLWLGVENVKILNGGFKAWEKENFPVESKENTKAAKTSFGVKTPAHPEYWVSLDEAVSKVKEDPNFKLVSIRSYDEFLGNTSGYNYMDKAGEPEGAVWAKSAKTAADVAYICNDDNTVMELSGMKKVWKDAGNDFDVDKNFCAFYCGTGWRACPPFLAMYQEGHKNMAVYDGGWYEYLFHDDLPVQVGDPQKGEVEHTTVGKLPTGKAAK